MIYPLLIGWVLLQEPPAPQAPPEAPAIRVPYQLTTTKHVLVRAKLNGKGPFNFILDTGAPAMFLSEAAAEKAGVEKNSKGFAKIDEMEIEGGVKLESVPCRVEDPFQLVGMNKMNLSGVRLDGLIGYSVLARYRITYDFTAPHLVWKKLDWQPPEVFGLRLQGGKVPAEMAAMSGLSTFAAGLIGKRPDPVIEKRGFIGLELSEESGTVRVSRVLPQSPANTAGVRAGDEIIEIAGEEVSSLKELLDLAARQKLGAEVALRVRRNGEVHTLELKTDKGF